MSSGETLEAEIENLEPKYNEAKLIGILKKNEKRGDLCAFSFIDKIVHSSN